MIYAVFVLDPSGMPAFTWRNEAAPKELFGGADESLVASFISALISFGLEAFAEPQRIDFKDFALTFFAFSVGKEVYWIVAVSDVAEYRPATIRFLRALSGRIQKLLSSVMVETGLFADLEGTATKEFKRIIEDTIRRSTRFLPNIRSDASRSFVFSLAVGAPAFFLISMGAYFISQLLFGEELLSAIAFLVFQTLLGGSVIGFLASNAKAGFASSFLSVIIYFLAQGGIENVLTVFLTIVTFIAPTAGLIAALVGMLMDQTFLKG